MAKSILDHITEVAQAALPVVKAAVPGAAAAAEIIALGQKIVDLIDADEAHAGGRAPAVTREVRDALDQQVRDHVKATAAKLRG